MLTLHLLAVLSLGPTPPQDAFVETRRMLPMLEISGAAYRAAASGDVSGNGWTDVLVARKGADSLFVNRGAGLFDDASGTLPAIAADTRTVELGDLDGDGDPDAYLVNRDLPSSLYENQAGTLVHVLDLAGASNLVES